MQSNRRQFLASIAALFSLRKSTLPLSPGVYIQRPVFEDPWDQPYTLKPRSAGITMVSAELLCTYQIPHEEFVRSRGGNNV